MLRLQGLMVEELEGKVDSTEKCLADLGGNSFASPCIMGAVLACLGSFQFASESEGEELAAISHAFRAISVARSPGQEIQ